MLIFLSCLTFCLWTLSFSLGKIALQSSSPIFLTAFRMGLAGILILLFLAFKKPQLLKVSRELYFPLFVFSILAIYLTNALEFCGLKYVSPAKACFIYSLSPFFAMILSYFHFKEKMSWQKILGLILAMGALIPVLNFRSGAEDVFRVSTLISWPELSLIGATFCSTYGWIVLRILVKNKDLSPLVINGFGMLLGGVMALGHSLVSDTWNPIPVVTENFSRFLQSVFLMTLISNLICYNLYSYLLKRLTATFLSFVGLLSPIFTSLSSFLILGEKISWHIIISTFFMLFAMWIVYYSEIMQGYIQKSQNANRKLVND